jgi:hypothetical protein
MSDDTPDSGLAFEAATRSFGFTPRCYREISFSPEILTRLHALWTGLEDGPLTARERLSVLARVAARQDNAEQLACWRRWHRLGGFEGPFELYMLAPELIGAELRPIALAVRDFFDNDGAFSDTLLVELFRLGKTRDWLHHALVAISWAELACRLSYLYEVQGAAEASE